MILIADSGSTKTDWRVIGHAGEVLKLSTPGINPFYQTTEEIIAVLKESDFRIPSGVSDVFFYGAGCAYEEKNKEVAKAIAYFLPESCIEIQSDLVGAARASCKRKAGITCILGTGSNSCYYDGKKIVENVSPLGYILGDEGSGAVMGKKLVSDYLKEQMPLSVRKKFIETYQLSNTDVLEAVYRKPFPNRYLAKFAPFLTANIEDSYVHSIVADSFTDFIRRNVYRYTFCFDLPVHFIGSVAYHLRPVLEEVSKKTKIRMGTITQSPIEGLIGYHQIIR